MRYGSTDKMQHPPARNDDQAKRRRMAKVFPMTPPKNVVKTDGSVLLTSLLKRS